MDMWMTDKCRVQLSKNAQSSDNRSRHHNQIMDTHKHTQNPSRNAFRCRDTYCIIKMYVLTSVTKYVKV